MRGVPIQLDEGSATAARKAEHLRINLSADVSSGVTSGFERWRFEHNALPEIDLAEVTTATTLFGRAMRAPVLISCMTGGTPRAVTINQVLAEVAQHNGLAMGLGSGRVLIEDRTAGGFGVRRFAPDIPLLANLGASHLFRPKAIDDCRRLIELTDANALVLHLNPLQEALQPEGEARSAGLLRRIEHLCRSLYAPVVVKEVGFGLAPDVVRRLFDAGAAGVDVAGAGGTSWSEVERHRLSGVPAQVALAFRGWGIPTADAVRSGRQVAGARLLIASGGLRDGMDVAKAIALGADIAGLAGPFLRAAAGGSTTASEFAAELITVLRIAMYCVGARDLATFRAAPRLVEV